MHRVPELRIGATPLAPGSLPGALIMAELQPVFLGPPWRIKKRAGEDEDEIAPACLRIKWGPSAVLPLTPSNLRSEIVTTFNCRSNSSKKTKCQSPLGIFQVFSGPFRVHWSLIRNALLPSASSTAVVGVGPFLAGLGAAAEHFHSNHPKTHRSFSALPGGVATPEGMVTTWAKMQASFQSAS